MFEFVVLSKLQAYYFVVDDCDRDLVEGKSLSVVSAYACFNDREFLHQAIVKRMGIYSPDKQVDHKNRMKWDNRRENLRCVSTGVNGSNRTKSETNTNKWGYKGVTYKDGLYRARVGYEGKKIEIGEYKTPQEAALAYDRKAIELYGEDNIILNFPKEKLVQDLNSIYDTYFVQPRKHVSDITQREDKLYAMISDFIQSYGYSPTKAELTKMMELSNHQTIAKSLLPRLKQRGLIDYEPGPGRNIRLVS